MRTEFGFDALLHIFNYVINNDKIHISADDLPLTCTLKVHVLWLLLPSVTVAVTTDVPALKVADDWV